MLLPLTVPLVLAVAERMRPLDRAEVYATRRSEDPGELAEVAAGWSRFGAVAATPAGTPAAAIGAVELWPGVWSVWMFATAEWPAVAIAVTRYARRMLPRQLLEAGAHRAECRSLASHEAAHRWMRSIGARREGELAGYGKDGEDFVTFAWRRVDFELGPMARRGT